MTDYSREALLEFLDYAATKGLMNANTASSRRVSSSAMLSILDDGEARDLRLVDLDDLMRRFANINSKKYSPGSLRVYLSRVKTSIEDFVRYQDNPAGFRPIGQAKPDKKPPVAKRSDQAKSTNSVTETVDVATDGSTVVASSHLAAGRATVNVPVPLQGSCVVTIHGLPVDLTEQEAIRITNVIKALASG